MKAALIFSSLLPIATAAGLPASAVAAGTGTAAVPDTRISQIMQRLGTTHEFSGVAVSPDGTALAWVLDQDQGARLELAAADGSHPRRVKLGTFKGCHIEVPAWSPDGGQLAFLSNCGAGKAQRAQNQLYVVDPRTTAPVARQVSRLDGYAHSLSWAADGDTLGFLYIRGDTHHSGATAATKARVGVTGVQHQQVALVTLADGKLRLLTPPALFVYEYSWSPDAKRLAYVAAPPPGENNWWVAKLYVQDAAVNVTPHMLLDPATIKGPLHGLQIALPRWSPDGNRIALIGGLMSDQGSTGGDIYLVPANGGIPVDVTPGIQSTPAWLSWTANDRLLVTSIASGATRISIFQLHGDRPASESPLLTLDASIGDSRFSPSLALSANHRRFAFIRSTFTSPPEIYSGEFHLAAADQPDGIAQQPHAVTRLNAGIEPLWGKAVSVTWSNEGYHVQGWLLYPADYDPQRRYPMIVYVHGGPSSAVRPRWPEIGYGAAPLSALGYFVLMPNPRGSFGEGETYAQAVRRDMGYGDLRDILTGVDTVEKRFPVDDHRLGLTGWSYGGFMSMFAPTRTARFRAVVAGAGISNWQSYYGENSIDQWMLPFFGASVYDDPAAYAKSSSINFIKHDKSPTLIIVGERDAECPAPQSFEQWHALRALGVPTELVVYAGEGHHFVNPEHRRDVLKRALAWFQRYLGQE